MHGAVHNGKVCSGAERQQGESPGVGNWVCNERAPGYGAGKQKKKKSGTGSHRHGRSFLPPPSNTWEPKPTVGG